MSALSIYNKTLLLPNQNETKTLCQKHRSIALEGWLKSRKDYGDCRNGEKEDQKEKEPEGKTGLSTSMMVDWNSMYVCDCITVKIIFFLVTNFTESPYNMAVVSELFHMQPEVIEVV